MPILPPGFVLKLAMKKPNKNGLGRAASHYAIGGLP
jgi:hypothetical protein